MAELFAAIRARDVSGVLHAIKEGADVNHTLGGDSPLHAAIRAGLPYKGNFTHDQLFVVVRALVEAGADVNNEGEFPNINPLSRLARYTDYVDIAEFLIKAGADVNGGYPIDGFTVLINSLKNVEEHAYDMVKLLIEYGADVNKGNPITESNNVDVTKLLLEHGADPNAKNRFGTSAFILALHNNVAVAKVLYEAGAEIDSAIEYAIKKNKPFLIERIRQIIPKAAWDRRAPLLRTWTGVAPMHGNHAAGEEALARAASIRRKNNSSAASNSNGKSRRMRKGYKGRKARKTRKSKRGEY